jgi:hypothetical protein
VTDGKSHLVSSGKKVEESLHLNTPKVLAKTIPPLNAKALSALHRQANRKEFRPHTTAKDKNTSKKNKKILNTKSTQWKEVLKEKNPSE